MKRLGFLLTIMAAISFEGCQPPVKADSSEIEIAKNPALQGIFQSPVITVSDEFLAFHDSDTIYLIRPKSNRSGKEGVPLKISYRDGSEVHKSANFLDFGTGFPIGQTAIQLGKVPLKRAEARNVQSVMFPKIQKSESNGGALKMDVARFFAAGNQICETGLADWQKQVYRAIFSELLKTGLFAEFPHGIYLLFSRRTCWVITTEPSENPSDFMLHLTKKEGGFDNYSFRLSGPSFENCSGNFEGHAVHRINLANDFEAYLRIRIGQYNTGGNLWAQEYRIERLLANPLLRYHGELKGLPEHLNKE